MLRSSPVRVLDDRDVPAALDVLARDPVANVFVQSRVEAGGLDPWRLGAEMWGHVVDGRLTGLCYAGANFVPVVADTAAINVFADRARRHGRRCSSIVGHTTWSRRCGTGSNRCGGRPATYVPTNR